MILKHLPVGAKVREKTSGIVFLVGEHQHAGYKGTTLVANNVIGQACLDAPEENNPNERLRLTGYNYYAFSNLHQWLNAEDWNWYKPVHEYDAAPTEENIAKRPNYYDRHGYNPYDDKAGFLAWFGEAFRSAIYESDVPCTNKQQNDIEYIKAKAFLLSTAEAGIRTSDPLKEGSKIAVFNDFRNRYAVPSQEAVANSAWQPAYFTTENLFWYWLRTPKGNDEGFTYYAHNANPYSHKFSCCPWVGIRPVVNVDSDLPIEASANVRGLYLMG
ncbi:MAG: hypothetical protein A2144_01570 [Chloroflexi bacterium RBG_16_50_9]|nr:MAG: hypothetical protein A2144_01570 [Chloroflexi bacterium RBG_16_50_9]